MTRTSSSAAIESLSQKGFARRSIAASLAAALGLGCAAGLFLAVGGGPSYAAEPAAVKADAAPAKVELKRVKPQDFAAELAKHKGKVVLVDFWATWCIPCLEQLPHTIKLHKEFAARGAVVIAVSMDDLDNEANVLAKLKELGAANTNFLIDTDDAEAAFEKLGIDNGALPHYQLFGTDGKLVQKFVTGDPDAVFAPADIDKKLEALLSKGK